MEQRHSYFLNTEQDTRATLDFITTSPCSKDRVVRRLASRKERAENREGEEIGWCCRNVAGSNLDDDETIVLLKSEVEAGSECERLSPVL